MNQSLFLTIVILKVHLYRIENFLCCVVAVFSVNLHFRSYSITLIPLLYITGICMTVTMCLTENVLKIMAKTMLWFVSLGLYISNCP